jgi:hypothetical protein
MKLPNPQHARPLTNAPWTSQMTHASAAGLMPQGDPICCAALCSGKAGFGACVARCVATGQACDGGLTNCTSGC